MDLSSIIPAALSAACALLVCLINNHFQVSKTTSLITYRLDQVEKKLDQHNNLISRMYEAEKQIDLNTQEINRHKERIRILENDGK